MTNYETGKAVGEYLAKGLTWWETIRAALGMLVIALGVWILPRKVSNILIEALGVIVMEGVSRPPDDGTPTGTPSEGPIGPPGPGQGPSGPVVAGTSTAPFVVGCTCPRCTHNRQRFMEQAS